MILFYVLLAIDVAAALVLLYFFGIGLVDGSVSSFNIALWLVLLAIPAGVVYGAFALNAQGRTGLANLLLAVPAAPAAIYGLFVLLLLVTNPRWN